MEEEFKKLESENLWDKQFEMLYMKTRKHSSDVADTVANKLLNRWPDVKPYDRSRVKLDRAKDTDYINANLVTVPKAARQYILTQGPLPETVEHFWLMVWEQKSIIIVMLNRIVEDIDIKCEQYWPGKVEAEMCFPNVNLTVKFKDVQEYKHYTKRELILCDNETNTKREITQFHYTAWPDHGQPESPTSFLRLLTAIRRTGGLDRMDKPTIVHCSAGIGRSGTFCLIDSILTMVENQGSTEGIDIANTLIEMRDYRMGLIQSPVQLRFSYMSIICGIKILERSNMLHPHISSIKDSKPLDNDPTQKVNGSEQNGKKSRRGRRGKQNRTNNSGSLNIFKRSLLVNAVDDIDSDEADSLFYDTMKPCPNIKKPRTSAPGDFKAEYSKQTDEVKDGSLSQNATDALQQITASTKAQLLTKTINSLLTENMISTNNAINPMSSNTSVSQNTDSVLLRRRERELQNQKLAEKTIEIKKRMKEEELKRERYVKKMAFIRNTAVVGGVTALVVSSLVYIYLQGTTSP